MSNQEMQRFNKWLKEVDRLFMNEFGLGYIDFPDYDWYSDFEDELSPNEAFEAYLEEQGMLE